MILTIEWEVTWSQDARGKRCMELAMILRVIEESLLSEEVQMGIHDVFAYDFNNDDWEEQSDKPSTFVSWRSWFLLQF